MINNIYPIEVVTDKTSNYKKVQNKGWKQEPISKSNFKSDHDIFNIKDNSQKLTHDKNYFKDLAIERSETSIDNKLRTVSPYFRGVKNQNFVPYANVSSNQSPDRSANLSKSAGKKKNERYTMKDILSDSNYGDKKGKIIHLSSLSIDVNFGYRKTVENSSDYRMDPLTPSKQAAIFQGYSIAENPLSKSTHSKKLFDLTDEKQRQIPADIKSVLYYQKNQAENNFRQRRTHSEGILRNFNEVKLNENDKNDVEKIKLQNQNELEKYYFDGERRDAKFESAKVRSDKKDQIELKLIEGQNFTNDFKKNVNDYLKKFDSSDDVRKYQQYLAEEKEKNSIKKKNYENVLKDQIATKKEKDLEEKVFYKDYVEKGLHLEKVFIDQQESERKSNLSYNKEKFNKVNEEMLNQKSKLRENQEKRREADFEKQKKLREIYQNELKEVKEKKDKFKNFMRNILTKQIEQKSQKRAQEI